MLSVTAAVFASRAKEWSGECMLMEGALLGLGPCIGEQVCVSACVVQKKRCVCGYHLGRHSCPMQA